MADNNFDMTYEKALEIAYPTYSSYRNFDDWAAALCEGADADTITNMKHLDAIKWAEVRGQLMFIARMFTWDDVDEVVVSDDLKRMYEDREGKR